MSEEIKFIKNGSIKLPLLKDEIDRRFALLLGKLMEVHLYIFLRTLLNKLECPQKPKMKLSMLKLTKILTMLMFLIMNQTILRAGIRYKFLKIDALKT